MKTLLVALSAFIVFTAYSLPSPNFGGIAISWSYDYTQPDSSTVNKFTVYYSQSGSSTTNMVFVPTSQSSPVTNTTILNLPRNTTYYVFMTAATPTLESDPTTIVGVRIPNKPGKITQMTLSTQ